MTWWHSDPHLGSQQKKSQSILQYIDCKFDRTLQVYKNMPQCLGHSRQSMIQSCYRHTPDSQVLSSSPTHLPTAQHKHVDPTTGKSNFSHNFGFNFTFYTNLILVFETLESIFFWNTSDNKSRKLSRWQHDCQIRYASEQGIRCMWTNVCSRRLKLSTGCDCA